MNKAKHRQRQQMGKELETWRRMKGVGGKHRWPSVLNIRVRIGTCRHICAPYAKLVCVCWWAYGSCIYTYICAIDNSGCLHVFIWSNLSPEFTASHLTSTPVFLPLLLRSPLSSEWQLEYQPTDTFQRQLPVSGWWGLTEVHPSPQPSRRKILRHRICAGFSSS